MRTLGAAARAGAPARPAAARRPVRRRLRRPARRPDAWRRSRPARTASTSGRCSRGMPGGAAHAVGQDRAGARGPAWPTSRGCARRSRRRRRRRAGADRPPRTCAPTTRGCTTCAGARERAGRAARCTCTPTTPPASGCGDGARARVRSRAGAVEVPVEVTDAILPGVVSIPHGWGHDEPGTRLRRRGPRTPASTAISSPTSS